MAGMRKIRAVAFAAFAGLLAVPTAWLVLRKDRPTAEAVEDSRRTSVGLAPEVASALAEETDDAAVDIAADETAVEDETGGEGELDAEEAVLATRVDADAGLELCTLIGSRDKRQRMEAVTRLPAFREDSPPVESAEDEEETDDLAQRVVYAVMTAALKDEDEDVRNAAFAALNALPDEERDMLSLQIMGNDDAVLKEALLRSSRTSSRRPPLALNIHGLESDDPAIVQLASENLLAATGRTFENAEQAYEWLEEEAKREASGEDPGVGDEVEIEFSDKDEVEKKQ